MRGYRFQLLVIMIAPAVAALLIAAGAAAWLRIYARHVSLRALTYTALPWMLRAFFLAYPIVSNVAFDAFPCYVLCVAGDEDCAVSCW